MDIIDGCHWEWLMRLHWFMRLHYCVMRIY